MIEVLKSIHLLSLLLAGAASVGNGVLLRRVIASGTRPDPMIAGAMDQLSKIGLAGIVTLWLTGIPLAIITDAFVTGGWVFLAKLAVATVVLGLVPGLIWLRGQMASGKRPQNPKLIRNVLGVVRLLTVLAVVLAVVAFN